jgi:hypothetical protein
MYTFEQIQLNIGIIVSRYNHQKKIIIKKLQWQKNRKTRMVM